MDVLNERIEEEMEEEAGHGLSSPETNSMAGRVRVGNEGPHFLIEVRRGRSESRKLTFDIDLDTDLWRAARGIGMQSPDGCKRRPQRDCRRGQTRPSWT